MTKSSLLRTLLALSLLLLGSGCMFTEYSTYSAPRIGADFSYDGINGVIFQIQDLDIAVAVKNNESPRSFVSPIPLPPFIPVNMKPTYGKELWVEIRFDIAPSSKNASDTIKTPVEFRPMEVRIRSAGATMPPKGFIGPMGDQTVTEEVPKGFRKRFPCKPAGEERRTDSKPVSMDGKICFLLAFDRSAAPDEPFTLYLNGLARAGTSIAMPEIRFEKGGSWRSDVTP